jgi:hypothetical protein
MKIEKSPRPCRQRLFSILVVGVFLSGDTTPAAAEITFEQYEVVTGTAQRQTVLSGFLLGGAMAELAVVNIDEKGDRRLRIYAFGDGNWAPILDSTLRPGVLFVDVANIGGRDRLITYENDRLNWFNPDTATERPLVEVATSYNATPLGLRYAGAEPTGPFDEGEIPRVDITRDLNHDGRDDLVLPDVDGFWIATQLSNGSFTDPVKLGPPEPFRDEIGFDETRSYGEVGVSALTIPWYMSRVHEMDYDQDGRSDLVFWNEDHFDVHLQDERGLFSPVAETFTTEVPFDSDGVYSLMFGVSDKSTFSLILGFGAMMKQTVLHSFHDVNGDRVADLVTLALSGRSLLRQRSVYEVHFGTPTPDGTVFARDVSTAVRPRGRAPVGYSFQWLQDFDGDGQVDIMAGRIKTGIGGMIRALLGTSITMSSEFYRLEDGIYPDKPTTARTIKSDIDIRGGRDAGFWPAVLVGDVNGDGRSDVLVGKSREKLHVFFGMPGPELLARQPQKVAVALPGDERNSWLVDLNKDGKQDVLLHRPSTTESHRVTMLIAR